MERYKGLKPVSNKDEAVSPIIATILLVAITVILASTLYLALGGFFSTSTSSTPSVGISAKNTTATPSTSLTYTITISNPSSNTISWGSTQWILYNGSNTITIGSYSGGKWSGSSGGQIVLTISTATGTYVTGGTVLTLTITLGTANHGKDINPTSIAFDLTGSNGGQMGTTSL
ncbi:MAG: type IV pilin [Candidatus Thermoplasmatota archaeon]|nr:type IV pilin [Candidatus Thermoplasmatota archaeon]MCL5438232.1 type IV pilin [Candidatus Thermoplasmatota archaeon]